MDARNVVIRAALAYGFDVHLTPYRYDHPRGFKKGPLGRAGINFRRSALWYQDDAFAEDMLHELAHLIVGKPSTWLSEGFVLMPFEWELAKHLAKKIESGERQRFITAVREYQECTEIGRFHLSLLDYGPGVRQQKWWKRGLDRAKRLGLLYSDNTPSYLRAVWKDSGVPTQARTWDPGYDERFP